jgi:hypothetical protein
MKKTIFVTAEDHYRPCVKAQATHRILLGPTSLVVSDMNGKQLGIRESQKIAARVIFWFVNDAAHTPNYPNQPHVGYNLED